MGTSKRVRIEPTHDWQLLLPLFGWPEQERYEQIRPLVLFDVAVAERAEEVGTSASTLYRRLDRFAEEGMESLFDAPAAKRRRLPPAVRRLVVDLKAEYPAFNLNEIANVVRAAFGRKPDVRSVGRVLEEEPLTDADGNRLDDPALSKTDCSGQTPPLIARRGRVARLAATNPSLVARRPRGSPAA